MVEQGIVTRADVTDPSIPNALGIKIGTRLDEVKLQYPKVMVEPHQYDPTGHYLIFKSADGRRAIVFEEGDGRITDVRAGKEPGKGGNASSQYFEPLWSIKIGRRQKNGWSI